MFKHFTLLLIVMICINFRLKDKLKNLVLKNHLEKLKRK